MVEPSPPDSHADPEAGGVRGELVFLLALLVLAFAGAYLWPATERLAAWAARDENVLADELFFVLLFAAFGFALFALRWWREARKEVAARDHVEEALRQGEARFRSLIENTSDIITILDADSTVLYKSPAVRRVLGYEPEELVGRGAFERVHPDDLALAQEAFDRKLLHPEVVQPTTYRFRHRDGSWRFLEATGSNRLADPAIRGIILVSRDVTERVSAEEDLLEHARSAELSFDIGRVVTAGYRLDEMLEHCSQAVLNYLGAGFVRIWTLNEEEQVLELQASAGMRTHLDGPHDRVLVGTFEIGRIAEERKPHQLPCPLSVSVGIAQYGSGELGSLDGLLTAADAAMYARKRAGPQRAAPRS